MASRGASRLPSAPACTPTLRLASIATPTKPMASPAMRAPEGRSPNQPQAMSAPNIGTVALSTEAAPLVSVSRA